MGRILTWRFLFYLLPEAEGLWPAVAAATVVERSESGPWEIPAERTPRTVVVGAAAVEAVLAIVVNQLFAESLALAVLVHPNLTFKRDKQIRLDVSHDCEQHK